MDIRQVIKNKQNFATLQKTKLKQKTKENKKQNKIHDPAQDKRFGKCIKTKQNKQKMNE